MQEQGEAMQRLAETDPLTWLFNRRHFDKRLEAETNRALRAEHLLALLMIDVDKFKTINDRFGHRVGDQVLKAVASSIKQAVRLYDVPTRYGGGEVALLLPHAATQAPPPGPRPPPPKGGTPPPPPRPAAPGGRLGGPTGGAAVP